LETKLKYLKMLN